MNNTNAFTMPQHLVSDLERLQDITAPCRVDMHEPDEQNIKVRVVGDHLDNACGNYIGAEQIQRGYQEFVVCIERFDEESGKFLYQNFNLANLIALARLNKDS